MTLLPDVVPDRDLSVSSGDVGELQNPHETRGDPDKHVKRQVFAEM